MYINSSAVRINWNATHSNKHLFENLAHATPESFKLISYLMCSQRLHTQQPLRSRSLLVIIICKCLTGGRNKTGSLVPPSVCGVK